MYGNSSEKKKAHLAARAFTFSGSAKDALKFIGPFASKQQVADIEIFIDALYRAPEIASVTMQASSSAFWADIYFDNDMLQGLFEATRDAPQKALRHATATMGEGGQLERSQNAQPKTKVA